MRRLREVIQPVAEGIPLRPNLDPQRKEMTGAVYHSRSAHDGVSIYIYPQLIYPACLLDLLQIPLIQLVRQSSYLQEV